MDTQNAKCKRCGTEPVLDAGLSICVNCEDALSREIRSISTLAQIALTAAMIFVLPGLLFAIFAIAKSGQTGSFTIGGARPTIWTVTSLVVTSIASFAFAIPILIGWAAARRLLRRKENEFEKLAGERLIR